MFVRGISKGMTPLGRFILDPPWHQQNPRRQHAGVNGAVPPPDNMFLGRYGLQLTDVETLDLNTSGGRSAGSVRHHLRDTRSQVHRHSPGVRISSHSLRNIPTRSPAPNYALANPIHAVPDYNSRASAHWDAGPDQNAATRTFGDTDSNAGSDC